jgi:ATP-dependent Clp protease protease subunit
MITGILLAVLSCGIVEAPKPIVLRLDGPVFADTVDPLIKQIEEVNESKNDFFILEMNTPGGSVSDGFRLVKAIENSPKLSVCVIDGEGYSMGFYILQSCDVRIMTKRSALMAHEPAFGAIQGPVTIDKLKSLMDSLRVTTNASEEFICKPLALPLNECKAKIHAEWWMDWKDAIKYRAVDAVVDTVDEVLDVVISKD